MFKTVNQQSKSETNMNGQQSHSTEHWVNCGSGILL